MPTFSLTSLYASRAEGITGSVIDSSTSLLQRQAHDIVRMAMGSPAEEAIPSSVFGALLGELAAEGASAFDYGPTEGARRCATRSSTSSLRTARPWPPTSC